MPTIPQPKPSEQLAVIAANVQMLHQGMEDIRSTQEHGGGGLQDFHDDLRGGGDTRQLPLRPGQHPRRADARVGNLTIRN